MYRIKAPKGNTGFWVPILANPDIVEHYSENVVDTLHKKNLLLLGEDRYLTTLMLKTFPKRKMIFCPQAVCKTVVPDTFGVLLSQRRRWINSTIHNLAELLLVRDLCGTFCFSMQFVVFMELAGTLVLPAAISFTIYLVVISIIPNEQNTTIPLILLGIILGLPGLLIVVTSRKVAYVGWMFIYLLSLPIWNFALPSYAFWHFDDFSWGQTRQISGEKKAGNHGDKEGEFDSSHIVMKRWAEFERERRWRGDTKVGGGYSRESMYPDVRSGSPKRYVQISDSFLSTKFHTLRRFSMVSTAETFPQQPSDTTESFTYNGQARPRQDSNTLLMLPAPLAVNRTGNGGHSASPSGYSRSSEDNGQIPDSGSRARLIPSPPSNRSDYTPPGMASPESYSQNQSIESYVSRAGAGSNGAVLRQGTVSSAYPSETQNPYRYSQAEAVGYDEDDSGNTYADSEDMNSQAFPRHLQQQRGVALADRGPVPGPDGVRRVARPQSRRPSSTQPTNRYSRTSMYGTSQSPYSQLPPGAAPPRPYGDS